MNKKIKNLRGGREQHTLKEIKQDCLKLKKRNDLTEYGEGQLDLSNIALKESKD